MKKNFSWKLALVILVAFAFRFYKLADFPVSLSIDEIIIGYDSYSILETGKDHYGQFMPLAFESIGDFKPPVLVYLMVPAIKIFGLNEFGIRFTIALVGSLTPLAVYFLVRKLLNNQKIGLIAAFLLAVSPWHVHFSRSTFEAVLGLLFYILALFVFIDSLSKKGKLWWLSGLLFSLGMYTYHAERVAVPLVLVGLLVIFFKDIFKYWKKALFAILISSVFLIPFFTLMTTEKGQTRARTGLFVNDYELATVRLAEINSRQDTRVLENILSGNLTNIFSFWINRYLEYSDFSYLFFDGLTYTHEKFPNVGVMLYFELPFFVLGLVALFGGKVKIKKNYKKLIFIWLLLGPIPATLANNAQHPLRSLTTLPMPQLISAIGIWFFFGWLSKSKLNRKLKLVFRGAFLFSLVSSLVFYLNLYYVHYPVHYSHYIMYGTKQAAEYVWQNKQNYNEIIFSPSFGIEDKNITGIPFAYVLVYGKVDPAIIQQARQKREEPLKFANITFRNIDWIKDSELKNSLLVGSFWEIPYKDVGEDRIVESISLYNGMPMFYLVETEKSD